LSRYSPRRFLLLSRLLILAVIAALLAGCSTTPQTNALLARKTPGIPLRMELTTVPFHPQAQYQCGPAALATVLEFSGTEVSPAALVPQVYVPDRQGSFQVEMLAATRRYQRLAYIIEPTLDALLASVVAGQPVLILQNLGLDWYPQWHYAVVVGYDLERRQILLRSGVTERYEMAMKLFERTWRRAGHWGMVALAPGELPAADNARAYFLSAAAFETHAPAELADTAWRTGLERWPESIELLMGHGNFLHHQGDVTAATERFRTVTTLAPGYGPGHNNLAQALMTAGRFDEALAAAQQAVAIGGELEAAYQATLRQAEEASQGD